MRIAGEGATISYLDPARWDAEGSCIVCSSAMGFARLCDLAKGPLATVGISITLQAGEIGPLAA